MEANKKSSFPWGWIVAAVVVAFLLMNAFRSTVRESADKALNEHLTREYGDAVQDYRSDPVRFKARIQEQVRQGTITQQEADEGIEMIRKMSKMIP